MAKASKPSSGMAKVRFIILEAEMDSGDLGDITAAIQNALKPRVIQGETRLVQLEHKDSSFEEIAVQPEELDADDVSPAATKRKAVPAGPRKFPSPIVVDVPYKDASVEITEFARVHDFSTTADKYLIVLAWFDEGLNKSGVSVNEVYTCFRKIGWPTNLKDFSQPLRDLKGQQVVTGNSKDGFTINHLGIDRVSKMRKSA
jgi:hypothetical protein